MEVTTGVIIFILRKLDNDCQILFLKRSGGQFEGQWWPVAGTCEQGEQPVKTVIRELSEETGLSASEIYLFGRDVKHLNGVSKLESFVVFVPPESQVKLNYEHSEFRWASVQEAIEIVPESVRARVQHVEHIQHIENSFINRLPDESKLIWRQA